MVATEVEHSREEETGHARAPKDPSAPYRDSHGINLQRYVSWLWEAPRAKTYTSPFARLALAA